MKILSDKQIQQKIRRIAYEIVENNFAEKELIIAGINNNGYSFAKLLLKQLQKIKGLTYQLTQIHINPATPLKDPITIDLPANELKNKVVIIVDDVANTGRTIFYACKPILNVIPKKVQVTVLVDRKHKSFPIKADYVGLSLATTLKDDILVQLKPANKMEVHLV